jgi:hypothetical protein
MYKIQPSYNIITIRKHRGAPAPGAPMVPTPMNNYDLLVIKSDFKHMPEIEYVSIALGVGQWSRNHSAKHKTCF